MDKNYFPVKLIAARATFMQDMTSAERDTMQQHSAYWSEKMQHGKVIVFGPVLDPKGPYGPGIICMKDEAEANQFMADDPAGKILQIEISPMLALVAGN